MRRCPCPTGRASPSMPGLTLADARIRGNRRARRGTITSVATTDADLVHRARAGDRGASAALVERHVDALRRACRKALKDPDAAADAAQDAVLTALLSLERLRDGDRFGA